MGRMKKNWGLLLMGGVTACLSSGCATIFSGNNGVISFSSDPSGASILIDGQNRGVTPSTLELEYDRGYMVELKLDGHQTGRYQIHQKFGVGYLIGDLFVPFFIGLIVDVITGDWWSLEPKRIHHSFEKSTTWRNKPGRKMLQLSKVGLRIPESRSSEIRL